MKDNRKQLGKWGEQEAKRYLIRLGYLCIAENWRNRLGEIDLIFIDTDTVVFVEVRTKNNSNFGKGYESINIKKQLQIVKMANSFLHAKNWWNRPVRFDIVSIDHMNGSYEINHLKNVIQ